MACWKAVALPLSGSTFPCPDSRVPDILPYYVILPEDTRYQSPPEYSVPLVPAPILLSPPVHGYSVFLHLSYAPSDLPEWLLSAPCQIPLLRPASSSHEMEFLPPDYRYSIHSARFGTAPETAVSPVPAHAPDCILSHPYESAPGSGSQRKNPADSPADDTSHQTSAVLLPVLFSLLYRLFLFSAPYLHPLPFPIRILHFLSVSPSLPQYTDS